jgi:excisionase family DNA binding protein
MQQVKSHSKFEPLIDVAEAAMLLRMHPRTLRAKARKRIIPAIQVGKRWRFRAKRLAGKIGELTHGEVREIMSIVSQNRIILLLSADTV